MTMRTKANVSSVQTNDKTTSRRRDAASSSSSSSSSSSLSSLSLTDYDRAEHDFALARFRRAVPVARGFSLGTVADARRLHAHIERPAVPEVAFAGRSNVGKSSLLNRLLSGTASARELALVSKTPGRTARVDAYVVRALDATSASSSSSSSSSPSSSSSSSSSSPPPPPPTQQLLRVVDMPGYGFARRPSRERERFADTIDAFLCERVALRRVFVLVDARHALADADRDFLQRLARISCPTQLLLTKIDQALPPHVVAALASAHATVASSLVDDVDGAPLTSPRPSAALVDALRALAALRAPFEREAERVYGCSPRVLAACSVGDAPDDSALVGVSSLAAAIVDCCGRSFAQTDRRTQLARSADNRTHRAAAIKREHDERRKRRASSSSAAAAARRQQQRANRFAR